MHLWTRFAALAWSVHRDVHQRLCRSRGPSLRIVAGGARPPLAVATRRPARTSRRGFHAALLFSVHLEAAILKAAYTPNTRPNARHPLINGAYDFALGARYSLLPAVIGAARFNRRFPHSVCGFVGSQNQATISRLRVVQLNGSI